MDASFDTAGRHPHRGDDAGAVCAYTKADLIKFNFYSTYWGNKIYPGLMGIAALTLLVDAAIIRENLQFLITPLALVAAANLYLPAHVLMTARKEAKADRAVVFRFLPRLFHARASFGDFRVAWENLYKIVQTRRYFYLYIERRTALIVPKRILNEEQKSLLLNQFQLQRQQG